MTDEPDPREVYEWVEGRLDMDYVRETAIAVAAHLRGQGVPLGVVLQPGDATRYDFALLPVQSLRHTPGRVVKGKTWDAVPDFGISKEPGTALVVYHQQNRAVGLDFRSGGFEPVYLGEKFETGLGSACTLALFFNAIAEAFNG